MFVVGRTLVSRDVLERKFVCDLAACKGACCVQGDAGAPLLPTEVATMHDALAAVLPYMDGEGKTEVARTGVFTVDAEGDQVTPLIDGGRCAFSVFDTEGVAKCAFEQAFNDGKTTFKKPVSCHLYPIRVKQLTEYQAVNYDKWDICQPACACGDRLKVPVYKFVREALVRRFGPGWFAELELIDAELNASAKQ